MYNMGEGGSGAKMMGEKGSDPLENEEETETGGRHRGIKW